MAEPLLQPVLCQCPGRRSVASSYWLGAGSPRETRGAVYDLSAHRFLDAVVTPSGELLAGLMGADVLPPAALGLGDHRSDDLGAVIEVAALVGDAGGSAAERARDAGMALVPALPGRDGEMTKIADGKFAALVGAGDSAFAVPEFFTGFGVEVFHGLVPANCRIFLMIGSKIGAKDF